MWARSSAPWVAVAKVIGAEPKPMGVLVREQEVSWKSIGSGRAAIFALDQCGLCQAFPVTHSWRGRVLLDLILPSNYCAANLEGVVEAVFVKLQGEVVGRGASAQSERFSRSREGTFASWFLDNHAVVVTAEFLRTATVGGCRRSVVAPLVQPCGLSWATGWQDNTSRLVREDSLTGPSRRYRAYRQLAVLWTIFRPTNWLPSRVAPGAIR